MFNSATYKYDEIRELFWPIAFTMIFTSTLSFVDTIMIAHYDLYASTAIAVVSNMGFLFGPVYFAILTGINIYSVQYYTNKRYDEMKHLAAIGLIILAIVALINFSVYFLFGDAIINFIAPSVEIADYAKAYLSIFMFSVFLQPLDMFFTYQYRAIKKPKIALKVGIFQSVLNIVLNYLLIYTFSLSIYGAAIATLVTRILVVLIHFAIANKLKLPFIGSIQKMFSFDSKLFKEVLFSTLPLIFVEFGFGFGNFIYFKLYALSGAVGLTAFNIAKTISFIINAFVIATANVSGIITGSTIAKSSDENLRVEVTKTMKSIFQFILRNSIVILLISIFVFPMIIPFFLYGNVDIQYTGFSSYLKQIFLSDYFKVTYTLIIINGIWMAIRAFSSSLIAILKSGNDNKFIILIEIGSIYAVGIPLTILIISLLSSMNLLNSYSIIMLRFMIIFEVLSKFLIGYYRYKQKKWIRKV